MAISDAAGAQARSSTWLSRWEPENDAFWKAEGAVRARITLIVTTLNLTMAFIVWFLVSAMVVRLPQVGFQFTPSQLFWLAAMPGLAGGSLRLVHMFLVPIYGTRHVVALSTLRNINANMAKTQSEISTGKSVASAKDNAAVWSISKVMESDVQGFKAISDSLALGSSTVAVARSAAETITDLLTSMKEKIVAAQEDNVDRSKINDDVVALRNQINSVVSAAQFNGLNLIDGSTASADVLASLDRDNAGNVSASRITVNAQNLSTGGYTAIAGFDAANTNGVAADGQDTFGFSLDANGGTDDNGQIEFDDPGYTAGDSVTLRIGDTEVTYTITQADIDATSTADVIAVGVKSAIEASGANVSVEYNVANSGRLVITNEDTTDGLSVSGQFNN